MNSLQNIQELILENLPNSIVQVEDLKGDGQHIGIKVQSPFFKGKTIIQQHRIVHNILKNVIGKTIHAVAIQTSTL